MSDVVMSFLFSILGRTKDLNDILTVNHALWDRALDSLKM